ncbi:hypothetical protein GCM10010439_35410 [Actinocorallia aurantiaca]|uniref:Uncharacterized protein n=1 Tax=Actinocorallia aurantiaca TaxID=46204 RepID=A0ABP6GPJ5_9ACTN
MGGGDGEARGQVRGGPVRLDHDLTYAHHQNVGPMVENDGIADSARVPGDFEEEFPHGVQSTIPPYTVKGTPRNPG